MIPAYSVLLLILLNIDAFNNIYKNNKIEIPSEKFNLILIQEYKKLVKLLIMTISKLSRKIYNLEIINKKEINQLFYKILIKNKSNTFDQMGIYFNQKVENQFIKSINVPGESLKQNRVKKEDMKFNFTIIIEHVLNHPQLETIKFGEITLNSIIKNNSELLIPILGMIFTNLFELII